MDATQVQVQTRCGALAGAVDPASRMRVFKGVPYAQPPVGDLRWRPPQPAAAWQGVRPALSFSASCPQSAPVPGAMDEDCLSLNIWAPPQAADQPLPVMVWVHGGGFHSGSAAKAYLDGARLAALGAVVVTFNYRVGLFGFLAHARLSEESPVGASGNYGFLDSIQALAWVRENIASFGGDPGRVTVFGVSAGSAMISLLLASPLAVGLFDQVILQSPGAGRPLASLAEAEAASGAALGTGIAALRKLSADELVARTSLMMPAQRGLTTARVLRPILDGWSVVEDERDALKGGRFAVVPTLVGSNADEGSYFTGRWPVNTLAQYQALLAANFPGFEAAAFDRYPAQDDSDVPLRTAELFADTQFNYGTRLIAQSAAARGAPVWRYLFSRRRPGQSDGPHHTQETPYVFGNLGSDQVLQAPAHDATDAAVSAAMMKAWVAFATKGKPQGEGGPEWPAYDANTERHLEFGDRVTIGRGWRTDPLDFLESFYRRRAGR